jgi:hypothetical protein
MYSFSILNKDLRHLASELGPLLPGPLTKYGVIAGKDNMATVFMTYIHEKYGPISPRVKINEKGEIYEPYFYGKQLSVVFDWLNRVGYDKERQINRTETFKSELISKTLLAGVLDIHAGSDSLE